MHSGIYSVSTAQRGMGGKYYLLVLYFITMLLPNELFLDLGGVRLEVYRIVLIISFFAMARFIPDLVRNDLAVKVLLLYAFIYGVSIIMNAGVEAIDSAGINFLEVFVGFLLGMTISGQEVRLKKFIRLVCWSFVLMAPFAIVEIQDGYRLLHVIASQISGESREMIRGSVEYLGDNYYRYGMHRASVIFSHPILYSICAALTLPLALYFKSKFLLSGLVVALITSVTSAGVVMVIIFFALYLMLLVYKFYKKVFLHFILLSIVSIIVLSFMTNRSLIIVISEMIAFNPNTAWARYLQWQFVIDDITSNLLIGIGFGEWSRPSWMYSSIDNYWIMTVLRSGIFGLLSLIFFYIYFLSAIWRRFSLYESRLFYAFFLIVIGLIFSGMTVHFFDRVSLYIFILFGMINSFLHSESPDRTVGGVKH